MEIKVTDKAVDKYMKRCGTRKRNKAKNKLKEMLSKSVPIKMKPGLCELRIIKNNFKSAEYTFYGGWYFVVVCGELKTVYQNTNGWFLKPDNGSA